jgi:hypothetical protein
MTAIESLDRFAQRRTPVVRPWRSRMTLLIAWRNLVHDRLRFAVTLVGIAFATMLMGLQLGMLLNFMQTTSTLIDHAGADIWAAARGIRAEDLATPLQERRGYQALSVPGVAIAENYLVNFGFWKRPDRIRETVIVGYACGIAIVLALAWLARDSSASPVVPLGLSAMIGVVTLAMCIVASLVSIGKVTAIDPVAVFRRAAQSSPWRGSRTRSAPAPPPLRRYDRSISTCALVKCC